MMCAISVAWKDTTYETVLVLIALGSARIQRCCKFRVRTNLQQNFQVEIAGGGESKLKVVVMPSLSKEMFLVQDWVGAHELIRFKEGIQGECLELNKVEGFLEGASREQSRFWQQNDPL